MRQWIVMPIYTYNKNGGELKTKISIEFVFDNPPTVDRWTIMLNGQYTCMNHTGNIILDLVNHIN